MIFGNKELARAAKQLLGLETAVVRSTDFCVKEVTVNMFFSWHQDLTYSG